MGICFRLMKVISYVTSQEFVFGFDLVRQLGSHPSRFSSFHRALVAIQTKRDEAAYRLFPSFHQIWAFVHLLRQGTPFLSALSSISYNERKKGGSSNRLLSFCISGAHSNHYGETLIIPTSQRSAG